MWGEKNRAIMHDDRQLFLMIGNIYGVCQENLTENLKIFSAVAKFSHLLPPPPTPPPWSQKQRRLDLCPEICDTVNDNPIFISRIITGDVIWVYGYDLKTKQQPSQWNSCRSHQDQEVSAGLKCKKNRAHRFFFSTLWASLTENLLLLSRQWILSFTVTL